MAERTVSVDDGYRQPDAGTRLPVCVFLAGVAAFGGTIGWFIGWGQSDASLSAIIPAVLSVVGGVGGGILLRSQTEINWLSVGGGAILVFSLGLFLGTSIASNARTEAAYRDFIAGKEERRQQYIRDLEVCTQAEVLINDARAQLELAPYTKAEVCPMLGIWPSDSAP